MRAIGSRGYSSSSAVTPTAPAPTDEIETSTPSATPTSTVARAIARSSSCSMRRPSASSSALRKISDAAVSISAKAEHHVDEAARGVAPEVELPQDQQRQDAGGNAAGGEPDHRRPVDASRQIVHDAAAGLGGGGVEQIGADRGRGVDAEQQDQQRRHQRTAADAGHADQKADAETRGDIEGIDHRHRSSLHSPCVIAKVPWFRQRAARLA